MTSISRTLATIIATSAIAAAIFGYRNATAAPVLRYLSIRSPDYPSGEPALRLVLFSDVHVHGPDMPPARLARIVAEVNSVHPDIVVAAGDFVGDNWVGKRYSASDAIAPLAQLKARLGVYAVLGNNDYDAGADQVTDALRNAGIRVLVNEAVQAGPIALGGIDGNIKVPRFVWTHRRIQTYAALDHLSAFKVVAAHRPDEFRSAPKSITLMLAGHTHCGQVVLPLIGPLVTGSDYGSDYLCGIIRDGPKTLVVTGGLGTSHIPLRIGASPDIWLITIMH